MASEGKPIIVGVKNDGTDKKVLEVAIKLGKKFSCPLLLVHGYETKVAQYQSVVVGNDLMKIIGHLDDHSLAETKKTLTKIAQSMDISTGVKILAGPPAGNLIAEAISSNAWLILVGSRPGGHKLAMRSRSVPLTLFNNSPIPVMVANDDVPGSWNIDDRFLVISADDLSQKGRGPTKFSAELVARAGEGAELCVFHVNPLDEAALAKGIESALAATYSQPTSPLRSENIYETLIISIKKSLNEQIPEYLRNKIKWDAQVMTGVPERELSNIIEREHAQLAAFGKHRAIHRQPFYFGKLPFATAFKLNTPFVIVPD